MLKLTQPNNIIVTILSLIKDTKLIETFSMKNIILL